MTVLVEQGRHATRYRPPPLLRDRG